MATLLQSIAYISRKADGTPNALGKVYTYAAGTLTPLASYTTQAGSVENTNPVILSADGTAQLWVDSGTAYRIIDKTAADVTIRDVDNVSGAQSVSADLASTAAGKGAALVGHIASGTGAVATTVQAKLREWVSVMDYGAVGDGVTDDTAAIVAANAAAYAAGQSLDFPRPASHYKITADVTLTADVRAGWYQLFDPASAYIVKGLRELRFEWFGAKGDAVSPSVPVLGGGLLTFNPVTHVPTGADDSAAIRKAMRCAVNTEMMSNYLDPTTGTPAWGANVGPGSQPFWGGAKLTGYPCRIVGRPGAGYLVSGDNILGPQGTSNGKIFFDGQGCSFEWLPSATNDSFIDKLDLIERPVLENFNLRTWGFTGNRGRFVHAADTKQFMNVMRGPLLRNINIDRGGYYNLTTDPQNAFVAGPTTGNALSKVLHLEGTNLCDTWDIDHCQAWGYANLLTLSNPEAVSISFHDSDFATFYPSAVHVDVTTIYSGGLWFRGCQLGMLGEGQTFFRTRGAAASIGEYGIQQSRMETRYDDFTVIDAEHGAFYIDGIQPNYGNPVGSSSAYSAKLSKWVKTVQFRNCWMPQKAQLWAYTDADFTTYSGNFEPVVFDCVTFPNGAPVVEWLRSDTQASVDIPAIFAAKLRFRDVRCINSPQDWNFANSQSVSAPEFKRSIAFFDAADGKTFIDNSGIQLPLGILITSIKVQCDSSGGAACDRINLAFTGGPSFQALISASDVTTSELIPATKKGVCVVSSSSGYNIVTADYYNGVGTPAAVRVPCVITFTYRSLLGATDLNTASLVPTLV